MIKLMDSESVDGNFSSRGLLRHAHLMNDDDKTCSASHLLDTM